MMFGFQIYDVSDASKPSRPDASGLVCSPGPQPGPD